VLERGIGMSGVSVGQKQYVAGCHRIEWMSAVIQHCALWSLLPWKGREEDAWLIARFATCELFLFLFLDAVWATER